MPRAAALVNRTLAQSGHASLTVSLEDDVFHAYENYEDVERMDVLRALFDQPGLHSYPFFEIPLNTQLFHVDVAPVDEGSRWQRFIFDQIENVLEFSAVEKIDKFRIYIQTRRESELDYQIKRIVEISKGEMANGESVYLYSCADDTTEVGGFSCANESYIARKLLIWVEPKIDE